MTATATAASVLAEIEGRTEAATPGPWAESSGQLDLPGFVMSPSTCAGCGEDWPLDAPDATFITHARTDVPRMAEALQRVLHLHRGRPMGDLLVCGECIRGNGSAVRYPCKTVAAITAALGCEAGK